MGIGVVGEHVRRNEVDRGVEQKFEEHTLNQY